MKKLYIVVLVFSIFSCKSQQGNNFHSLQKIENYNGRVNSIIEEKLLSTPQKIIDLLNEMDSVDNYSSYELDNNEKQLFVNYYHLLPTKYQEIIKEKVVGIYFINNFLGGGMTEAIFDNNENMYMVLFFNPEILSTNISEWINFRDNSVFINNGNKILLKIDCNSDYFALIHTLFHEASHVYDFYNFITPYTEEFLKNDQTIFPTDFIRDIWLEYNIPNEKFEYAERENISFYNLGKKTETTNIMKIYSVLKNTPFNSLYGSKTWAEDFAEAFSWYYLNKFYGIDYITKLFEDDRIIMTFNPNENEMVKRRYKIFEEIGQ